MNLQRIEQILRARFLANPEDVRARRLARKIKRTLSKRLRRAKIAAGSNQRDISKRNHFLRQIEHMQKTIASGGTVVAFDAEWPYAGTTRPVHEIGVSILRPTGITTENIIVVRNGKTHRKDRFPGGSRFMTEQEIVAYFKELWLEAKVLLGHNLKEDFQKMKAIGANIAHPHYFDTVRWSQQAFPEAPAHKLSAMAQSCEVKARAAHIAGNDSAMVLDCALFIMNQSMATAD